MKIISFLGFNARGYTETTYLNPDKTQKCKTEFFQEALVEFYHPEFLYVLLTQTAEAGIPDKATESTWNTLQTRLKNRVKLKPIKEIPENHEPKDIWLLFEKLTNCLNQGEQVLFDITNGFRSLPILALIAISYLRVVKQVEIIGLVYGAFDAKNKETNETPTFDLLPIVSLLDWTTATDQFIKTGNGQALASLLERKGDSTAQELSQGINAISEGLHLLRPNTVMEEAAKLPKLIQDATPTISQSVPQFAALLRRVQQDYAAFGLEATAENRLDAQAALVCQLKMIEWYIGTDCSSTFNGERMASLATLPSLQARSTD